MTRPRERATVLIEFDRSEWRSRAVCSLGEVDPELFFPVGSGLPALRQIAAAKAVCARCPVISACLMSALGRDEKGVWGGLSEDERSAIRRRAAAGRTPRVHARSVGRVIECTPAQG